MTLLTDKDQFDYIKLIKQLEKVKKVTETIPHFIPYLDKDTKHKNK